MHSRTLSPVRSFLVALTLTAPLACGESGERQNNIAKAFEKSDPKAAAEQASRDMKRLKERTAAKAEEAVRKAIDEVTIVPAQLPTSELKAACGEAREAYDSFVQTRLAGDKAKLERWNVFKPMDLDKAEDDCLDRKNLQLAHCQAHAFTHASREITRGRAPEILARCLDKFGTKLGANPAAADLDRPS